MSWSDYGFPKVTFATLDCLKGLLSAYTERYEAINANPPEDILPVFSPVFQKTYSSNSSWALELENRLENLAVGYVNHTLHNGDFSSQTIIPMWSLSDIYDYLEEEPILLSNFNPLLNAKWLEQKYRVINTLRWSKKSLEKSLYVGETHGWSSYKYLFWKPGFDYSEVRQEILELYSNSYESSPWFNFWGGIMSLMVEIPWDYLWLNYCAQQRCAIRPPCNSACRVMVYGKSDAWGSFGEHYYDRAKAGVPWRTWKKLGECTNDPSQEFILKLGYENYDELPYPLPATISLNNVPDPQYVCWEFNSGQYLLDHCVENGFEFQ